MSRQFPKRAAIGLLLFLNGCAPQTRTCLLERHFEHFSIVMQHGQYFASARIRTPEDREEATAEIIAYLRSDSANVQTRVPGLDMNLQPPLRSRDFWALVLAGLQDRELTIMAYDDVDTRDRKIREFVGATQSAVRSREPRPVPT